MWSSVPAAGLSGRRRMAIVWTALAAILSAVNLHFFWTAQHISPSSTKNESIHSGFDVINDKLMLQSEANTVRYNLSVLSSTQQSTSDPPLLSSASQSSVPSSSTFYPFPKQLAVLGTSKLSNATLFLDKRSYIILYYITSYHVVSCRIVWYYIILYHQSINQSIYLSKCKTNTGPYTLILYYIMI